MLTREQRNEFGKYLRGLREGKGLSLRDVQKEAGISPGYLSLVEAGERNPPAREFLIKLARLYGASPAEMLRRGGRMDEGAEEDLELDELRRAYEFVIRDPRFQSGHSLSGEPTPDIMRFMVEMYEKGTGKILLGGKPTFRIEEED
jgi:HTH-type transcriptional regulator, competence development regulator